MNLLITISSVGHSMRIEDEPFVRINNYTLHYLQNISSYHGFKNRTRGETVFASSSQFNLVFSDWIGGWFLVQPARPAGPVWLLKPCILYNFFLDKRYNLINIYIYIYINIKQKPHVEKYENLPSGTLILHFASLTFSY